MTTQPLVPAPDHVFMPVHPSAARLLQELVAPRFAATPLGEPVHRAALAAVMDQLLAMDEKRLVPVNVNVTAATTLVIGALTAVRALRPEMVARLGETMASAVDRLELVALAAAQASAVHMVESVDVDLQPLAAQVAEMRAVLLADIRGLQARKLLPPTATGRLRGGSGFANLAFDVLQLGGALRSEWAAIESTSTCTMAELDLSEGLANQLLTTYAIRKNGDRPLSAELLQRAFTLLHETYDEVRQMVSFLRWKQGDADQIAPSWHRGRKRRRKAPDAIDGLVTEGPRTA
jgi:hypothetical protein